MSMFDLLYELNQAISRDYSEDSLEDLESLVVLATQLRNVAREERDRKKETQRLILSENSPMPMGARKTVSFRSEQTAPERAVIRIDGYLWEDWMNETMPGKLRLRILCEELALEYPIDDEFPFRVEGVLLAELLQPHPNRSSGHSDPHA